MKADRDAIKAALAAKARALSMTPDDVSFTCRAYALRDADELLARNGERWLRDLLSDLDAAGRERDEAISRTPTVPPNVGPDRLILNAYGRRCYDEGQKSASAALAQARREERQVRLWNVMTGATVEFTLPMDGEESSRLVIEQGVYEASVLDALPADASPAPECVWREDEDGNWDASCGQCYGFWDGSPADSGQRFCCFCGRPLRAVPKTEGDK